MLTTYAQELADDIDHHLLDKILTTRAFSVADVVLDELNKSNHRFAELGETQRRERINYLNAQWIASSDENDPFIKPYMANAVAKYLSRVATVAPHEFGEIFVTNRYGVIIGTTNKLTTLAHSDKYWWKAAYEKGTGRVFLDDRGFDQSVKGYVIGVVVPIKQDGQIIGILKANLNIMPDLSKVLWGNLSQSPGEVSLVRSGGLIVLEKETPPLSKTFHHEVMDQFDPLTNGAFEITVSPSPESEGGRYLVVHAPVSLSLGSKEVGFGGKYRSIDQHKGNEGESWLIIIKKDINEILEPFGHELKQLLLSGFILLLLFVMLTAWITRRSLSSD